MYTKEEDEESKNIIDRITHIDNLSVENTSPVKIFMAAPIHAPARIVQKEGESENILSYQSLSVSLIFSISWN
jgi:hypothetical protein